MLSVLDAHSFPLPHHRPLDVPLSMEPPAPVPAPTAVPAVLTQALSHPEPAPQAPTAEEKLAVQVSAGFITDKRASLTRPPPAS
jgi:hypothetical protein